MESTERFKTIVERLRTGSEDAFHELYNALSPRVFSYLMPRAGSRENALDVLQDVFLGLWSSRLRFEYRGDASVWGFVFLIARRALIAHYKGRAKDALIEGITEDARYDMDLGAIGDIHTIERVLPKLSDDDREVVTLRYWSGFSFGEIAEMLGKEESAIRVKHHRALKKLESLLPHHE